MAIVVEIPSGNVSALVRRVSKLAERARTRGMPDVAIRVIDSFDRITEIPDHFARLNGNLRATRSVGMSFTRVELEGVDPWASEWKLIGSRTALDNIGDIPERMKIRKLTCDHCGEIRNRVRTYILEHRSKPGEVVEIGSSCLGDFLGSDPRVLEGLETLFRMMGELDKAADPYWRLGQPNEVLEESRLVLAVANRIIEETGFVGSARARATGETATWKSVANALHLSRNEIFSGPDSQVPMAADYLIADECIAWCKEHLDDPFVAGVAEAVERGLVGPKEVAVLTAGMATYRRNLQRADQAKKEAALAEGSVHVGLPGERIQRLVHVRRIIPYESSRWGSSRIVLMSDPDGNLLSWFTGADPGMQEGRCYEIRGTVKSHDRVRKGPAEGAAETKFTRVSILADLGIGDFGLSEENGLSDEESHALDQLINASPRL